MGHNDNRHTPKMRRRRNWRKKKMRERRKREGILTQKAGKTEGLEQAPRVVRVRSQAKADEAGPAASENPGEK